MDAKAIAQRLVSLRGNKTRAEVANACGVSTSALAMYEGGERIPRDEIKMRLARFYNVTVESIFYA